MNAKAPPEIGDFSRPTQQKTPTPATTSSTDEAEKQRLEAELSQAKDKESPAVRYQKALQEVGLTPEKAGAIIDDMISKGYHEAEFDVIPNRLKIRLRSRKLSDSTRVQRVLEEQRPVFESTTSVLVNEMLLAASIVQLGTVKYDHPAKDASNEQVEASFAERRTKILTVSDHIMSLCFEQRAKFDERLRVVCREGSVSNF